MQGSPSSNSTLCQPHDLNCTEFRINLVIRDVFIDYTKNYLTPEDIIYGHSPTKWSFGSSIFFSWTAITTIGYGHIVPRTVEGRISCLLYALFGIPLILVTIADMGRFLSGGIKWVHGGVMRVRKWVGKRVRLICRWLRRSRPWRWWLAWRRRAKRKGSVQEAPPITTISVPADEIQMQEVTSLEITGNHVGSNQLQLPPNNLPPPLPKNQRAANRASRNRPFPTMDSISDAGTFEDISEIQTQQSERTTTTSADTHARADELRGGVEEEERAEEAEEQADEDDRTEDEFEPLHQERRVSVMFILVVMLGYTAGGACLMQLWERWDFMDAFYFCFVTVTTIGIGR